MERVRTIGREGLRTNLPDFLPGDTIRVMVRVREGDKERLQAFEGVCVGRRDWKSLDLAAKALSLTSMPEMSMLSGAGT